MKRGVVAVLIIAFFTFVILLITGVNFNRFGASYYYTYIEQQGKATSQKQYEYVLPSYTKNGTMRQLSLTSQDLLSQETYYLLYVKDEKGVISYKEVDEKKVPKKAIQAIKNE